MSVPAADRARVVDYSLDGSSERLPAILASLLVGAGVSAAAAKQKPWHAYTAEEVRVRDPQGATALHWAIWFSNLEAFQALAKTAPDLAGESTKEGHTPLMWACLRGETAYTLQFVQAITAAHPESIHEQDANGLTPLILAIQGNNKLAALFLLYHGADPNVTDKSGSSAMAWAAFLGEVDFLFLLTGSGADANCADRNGMTPLHRAAQRGHDKFVACLLDAPFNKFGVQRNVLNSDNLSALDISKEMKFTKVEKKIKAAGRPPSFFDVRVFRSRFPRFYLSAVALCALLWAFYLLPSTWESLTPAYHYTALFLLLAWLANWYRMVTIDPGTAATHAAKHRLRKMVLAGNAMLDAADVCFTCRIIKPLRSKHDSVTNVCYYRFDHYCGWIGYVVAEDNYPAFVLHVYIQLIGHLMFLHMCFQAQYSKTALDSTFLMFLFITSFSVNLFGLGFSGVLVWEHTKQALGNVTTNEIINRFKYKHFQKVSRTGEVAYVNPFDKGWRHNMRVMLTRPERRRVYHKDGSISFAR